MTRTQTVQDIYAAFGRGDIPSILERLAENVAWEADGKDHGIPVLVPRQGRREVVKFFEALAPLEFSRFEVGNLLEGGNQVGAIVRVTHTHKGTGKTFDDVELHLWTFDDAGRITAFRHLVDTHQLWLQFQA